MGPLNRRKPLKTVFPKRLMQVIQLFFPGTGTMTITDDEQVTLASRLLNISEFRFFQIAYSRWYGREISEKDTEPVFSIYLMKDIVPHWVRHFSREVVSRYFEGSLDPGDYNIQCRIPPCEMRESRSFLPLFLTIFYLFVYFIARGDIAFP